MKKLKDKYIVVIGAARSGVAVAKLLKNNGAEVFITDNSSIAEKFKNELKGEGISFEENNHTQKAAYGDFGVISPGVPTESSLVQAYLMSGKEIFSEIEVASWFNKSSVIAVTGSNGKTTVTNWLDHTWKLANKAHLTAGNVGNAFSASVETTRKNKDTILEVSSFQLDHIQKFHPHISLILNITPDHLERYQKKLESYAQSKFRITKNQTADDWLIYYRDNAIIGEQLNKLKKKAQYPNYSHFHQHSSYNKELLYEIKTSY